MNVASLLAVALQALPAQSGATVDSVRAAVPMIFEVVSAPTPTGPYIGVLVPKRPPPSVLQPVVMEHGYMVTYLIQEGIGFKAAAVLTPNKDSVTLHRDFATALAADSSFMASLVPLAQARLMPAQQQPVRSTDRAVAIGARFFYPDVLLPSGDVRSRLCADAKGVSQLDGPRDLLLEAFVYQALARVIEVDRGSLWDPYQQLVRQVQAGGASSIEGIRTSVWAQLERDALVRQVIVASYEQHAATLPFRLQ